MANTTNFGWETPDDTDLVKDGAAAIRTLGSAIDTSLLDLKGGTTDQVLAKNSNTDMDFKWVAQDDSNAIQNAIVDAKGDLISATAADTPARLAVGANDTVLTADSSTSTGLKWAAPATGALTLLSSTTFSASSSHSVNDVFSSTYANYLIILNIDSISTGSYINMRLRVSGSDNTSSNYYWSGGGITSGSTTFGGDASNGTATSWSIQYQESNGAESGSQLFLYNPFATKRTTWSNFVNAVRSTDVTNSKGGGGTSVTTSYTGFTLFPASGNMTGGVRVYGYANS